MVTLAWDHECLDDQFWIGVDQPTCEGLLLSAWDARTTWLVLSVLHGDRITIFSDFGTFNVYMPRLGRDGNVPRMLIKPL
jgi:hypothetical protein